MQIRYEKDAGVILVFPQSELKVALGILKAVHKVCGADFILSAINQIEEDLKPKELPMINYHSICHHCFRDLDTRDPNSYLMTTRNLKGVEDRRWIHYKCDPLKEKRP